MLIFSYGRVSRVMDGATLTEAGGRDYWLLALWGVIAVAGGVAVWRSPDPLPGLTMVLNVAALVLVGVAASSVVLGLLDDGGPAVAAPPTQAGSEAEVTPVADLPDDSRPPDIYLLVFDRYGGERTLQKTYGFDNTGFLAGLEDAASTSPTTPSATTRTRHTRWPPRSTSAISTTSRPAPGPTPATGNRCTRWSPTTRWAVSSRTSATARCRSPSWWEPTRNSTTADVTLSYDPLSEFSRVLLNTTAVQAAAIHLGLVEDEADPRRVEWNRVQYQLEQVAAVPHGDQPVFVFAHVLLPHHPYVFAADGSFQTVADEEGLSQVERYVGQVEYANDQIELLVDELARRAREPAADHPASSPHAGARRPGRDAAAPPPPGDDPRTG